MSWEIVTVQRETLLYVNIVRKCGIIVNFCRDTLREVGR